MGSAVVRCTSCLGASQVEAGALGLTVRCPRCDATFVAVEEVEVVTPTRPARNPMLPVPEPVAAPRREGRRRNERTADPEPRSAPESNHDPHLAPSGPLPASVLIGLALLPFAIPILWLVAPAVIGVAPAMSIATPSALAISASILCLAVIYTVDWTPTTRIKGVLMLVGLAYFGAVSLYFLKKEMVERVKRFTGLDDGIQWQVLDTGDYQVKMPGPEQPHQARDLPIRSIKLDFLRADCERPIIGQLVFIVGSGELPENANGDDPKPATDAWFDQLAKEIVAQSGGLLRGLLERPKYGDSFPGRQLQIQLPENTVRIVRVFVIKGRLYYLAVEGFALSANDHHARPFFESFHVPRAND
jgi:hypothetical protein